MGSGTIPSPRQLNQITRLFRDSSLEPLVVGMWDGEAQVHPDFRPIIDVLAGLALDISGGVAK
jgi:hypothetical protein